MSEIIWGGASHVKLPVFDVCWTSPPYEIDTDDLYAVTQKLYKVAKDDALLWVMHPEAFAFAGWDLITHCSWCMTESDVDKAYIARGPLEVMHDIWLFKKRGQEHYWKSDYWMPNWLAGGLIESDATYLPVPTEVIQECLGASLPSEGKTFLDPYCGTASSVCTAHEMGFHAIGIEINEQTVKNARMRLKAMDIELSSERFKREAKLKDRGEKKAVQN